MLLMFVFVFVFVSMLVWMFLLMLCSACSARVQRFGALSENDFAVRLPHNDGTTVFSDDDNDVVVDVDADAGFRVQKEE